MYDAGRYVLANAAEPSEPWPLPPSGLFPNHIHRPEVHTPRAERPDINDPPDRMDIEKLMGRVQQGINNRDIHREKKRAEGKVYSHVSA